MSCIVRFGVAVTPGQRAVRPLSGVRIFGFNAFGTMLAYRYRFERAESQDQRDSPAPLLYALPRHWRFGPSACHHLIGGDAHHLGRIAPELPHVPVARKGWWRRPCPPLSSRIHRIMY